MKLQHTNLSSSEVELTINLEASDLKEAKAKIIPRLKKDLKVDGFRQGKAPDSVAEKNLNQALVAEQVAQEAINEAVVKAVTDNEWRLLDRPRVDLISYVPDQSLEAKATIMLYPEVKLMDLSKIKLKAEITEVKEEDVDKVLSNLAIQAATKEETDDAAKDGDEVWIDFEGKDKDGKELAGASGKDYPLRLGSKTFIPGFEEQLEGSKKGDSKSFDVKFPDDYHHKPMASKEVKFSATVKKVNKVIEAAIDDEFAKKMGPFENLAKLKADVKKELQIQKAAEVDNKRKDELMMQLVEGSEIEIPALLLEDQKKMQLDDMKANTTYRGITWPDFLKQEGKTEEEYDKEVLAPKAERSVKVGLIVSEVANKNGITVTDEELATQIEMMKQRNTAHADEFDKPERQRELANRMITEKTLSYLLEQVK